MRYRNLVPESLESTPSAAAFDAGPRPDTRDRAAIAERFRWDLGHIYQDWNSWDQDLERLKKLMDQFAAYKGTLGRGGDHLVTVLRDSDELGMLAYRVYQYPSLTSVEDTRDNSVQARLQQVQIAFARFKQATAWMEPEMLQIPFETMKEWLDGTEGLSPYRFTITETYRRSEHVLDEDGERLLAFATPFNSSPRQTFSMLADADVRFAEAELSTGERIVASHANYAAGLRTRRDQGDREKLFKAHFSVYDERPNSFAAIYNGILQRDWFMAQARRYASCLEAALDPDNIPVEVVETLIATARAGAGSLQRYHRLRRQVLGLERYRYFDGYLPLVDAEWPFHYDSVRPILLESVEVFGPEYVTTAERAFDERWIDVYESEGKRSGAFSAGVYGVHPYMMLNHGDTISDAFTVAHEMGHTMHTVLSHEHQPFATANYTIFVAEVASMTNEALFLDVLLGRERDPRRRAMLLQHAIDGVAAGFYRQTMFADYELQAHRAVENGEPITSENLQALYLGVLSAFFGDSLSDQEWYRNTWARIPHFYNSPFYVYQYATSKAAASLIHRRMTAGDNAERSRTVERYLELLRSGGNDHPVEQLRLAGVDFATSEPVEALVATMDDLVSRLEAELTELGLVP